jgi:hypothetical protein
LDNAGDNIGIAQQSVGRNQIMNRRVSVSLYLTLVISLLIASPPWVSAAPSSVTVREQNIVIPTYLAGEPEPNPMFYFGRASQGAQSHI